MLLTPKISVILIFVTLVMVSFRISFRRAVQILVAGQTKGEGNLRCIDCSVFFSELLVLHGKYLNHAKKLK